MRYRDTISKLSFALVFIYLVFDIKMGGIFSCFDSSYFKLIASFVLIYLGLSVKPGADLNTTPSSIISIIMGIFGKQFNSESGYDFYYFAPAKLANKLEYSAIISGILGLKLLISTYCADFSWYVTSASLTGISETICLFVIFLDFYVYFQIFAKLRLHDFLYQVYYLQNSGGAWASMYICQIQSLGYVLSLVVYIIEFLESISQEFLDIILYNWDYIYQRFSYILITKENLQVTYYNFAKEIKEITQEVYAQLNFSNNLYINNSVNNFVEANIKLKTYKNYKIQKYCNTNILDINFLFIKKLFITKNILFAIIKSRNTKLILLRDNLRNSKNYLYSGAVVSQSPIMRC